MRLNSFSLHNELRSKGISHFFHANTVATAISFILAGGLLSRGDVERRSIFQTPQRSDFKDRTVDVWDDVFLDTVDLHLKFGRQNKYGPVTFEINIDFLLKDDLDVWVTRDNPENWSDRLSADEKYFQDVSELVSAWDDPKSERRMITIRKPASPVLFSFVDGIIFDYFEGNVFEHLGLHAGRVVEHSLYAATETYRSLRPLVRKRTCSSNCFCAKNYKNELSDQQRARLFCPKDLIHSG
jgi:hypothetical protein